MNSFDKIFEASQRKCGACGETGHNARTCKSKSVPFSTGGFWNEKTFDGLEQLGLPFVDASHVAMISKIVDGEVLKEPNARVQIPRITWKKEPITMTWGELDEKCKKQDLVSIGESTYSGSYLRSALAYLPKNTVLNLYTDYHFPLKATFEYGGEEWIFFLAPRVEAMYAENLKDWSEQEMKSHGKDVSFKDFIKKEIKSHGNIDLVDWAKHEEKSHKERYGAEKKSNTLDNKTHQKKYMAQGYTDDEMLQAQYPNYFLRQKFGDNTYERMEQVGIYPNLFIALSGVDNDTLEMLEDIIYFDPERNMGEKMKQTIDNAREYRNIYYKVYKQYPPAYSSKNYYGAETFGADYSFTGKIKKYGFELSDGGKEYVITYGGRRIPSFRLPKDTYFHGKVYTIERFVEELNQNQERAVSDVFNFLWNKTNNGHLDDILMNRAETFDAPRNREYPEYNEEKGEYEGTIKEIYKDPKTNEIRVRGRWFFPQGGEWVEYDERGCQFEGCSQMGSPEWYNKDYCDTPCYNGIRICGKNKTYIDTFMGRQRLIDSWQDGPYGTFCQSLTEDEEGIERCNDCDYEASVYGAETFETQYAGVGSLMDIGKGTSIGSFSPEELTESSAIHGDFDSASLNYSGNQNIVSRAEGEESNFGSVGEGNNFGQMRAEGDGENCPRCNSESLGNRICSQCGHEWEIDVGQFNTESLIEEPDFIPDGDGRALGQQTSSINLSPLHAESKVLSKTNLVIAGVIGLGLWKGKQILDTAKSSLKQSAENKKKGCSTCNSNGTVRKNHTQVKQSEYSVNQINPVEAEGQSDIHGAEGVTNPRHAPSSQPFGYPSKSLKMW